MKWNLNKINTLPSKLSLLIYFLGIFCLFLFFWMTAVSSLKTSNKEFRGFLISQSLRTSEFSLPGWPSYKTTLLPNEWIIAINNQDVSNYNELEKFEANFLPAEKVKYTFKNIRGDIKDLIFKRSFFNGNDLLLTHGAISFSVLILLTCLIPAIILAPPNWRFSMFLYDILGAIWLLSGYDYYSSYIFSKVFILAGALVAPAALHFNTTICDIPKQKTAILWAYGTGFSVALFHIFHLQVPGKWDWISFLSIWIVSIFWSLYTCFLLVRIILKGPRLDFYRNRALLIFLPQLLCYGLPLYVMFISYMFGVKVPINQFVFLLSLVPICVVFLCFSEKILGLQRSLQKELSTKERFVSLGVLSAGLAHEMNNPLHNLSMNVHVLKVNLGKNNIENIEAHQEKIEKIVDKILKSVSRVNGIVESINSFAKNNLLLKPSIDLTEIIKQSLFSFEEKILSKNLNVSTQFHNVEMVTVAPNAIQQIFCNLFSNSIYAVGDGGRIHINAGLENHELRFSVFDDGPGIPEDIQTHIFDPFFTTKKTGEGMGLGLWISSQLVSAHGGQIVCSKPETGGTLIEIIIPQGKEPQFKLPKIIKEKINKSSMFLEMNG